MKWQNIISNYKNSELAKSKVNVDLRLKICIKKTTVSFCYLTDKNLHFTTFLWRDIMSQKRQSFLRGFGGKNNFFKKQIFSLTSTFSSFSSVIKILRKTSPKVSLMIAFKIFDGNIHCLLHFTFTASYPQAIASHFSKA